MDLGTLFFVAISCACLGVVGVALRTGRILGIAFRSRFIARRERQPALFWASLAIYAVAGLFLAYVVISMRFH